MALPPEILVVMTVELSHLRPFICSAKWSQIYKAQIKAFCLEDLVKLTESSKISRFWYVLSKYIFKNW